MFIVPIFFIRFVFWAARGARRRAALLGAAAALACAPATLALQDETAAGGGGRDAFYYSLLASFASAHGRHDEATAIFARLAAQSGDDFYHRRAVEESIRAKRLPAAIENARLWRDKFPAARAPRQTLAELLTLAGRLREARPLLARLLAAGEQSPHDLFKQLAQAPDRGAGRALLSSLLAQRDDAESLLARIRFALIEQDAAAAAALLARARASFPYRVEWALAGAAAAATQGGFAEALAALESYRADGCPGAPNACLLPQLIYAYESFRNGREWRGAIDDPQAHLGEATFAAAALGEEAGLDDRALEWYRAIPDSSQRRFLAALGLARIHNARREYDDALRALAAVKTQTPSEAARRETTIIDIVHNRDGAEAAYARALDAARDAPEDYSLLYQRSFLAEELGDVDEAIAVLTTMTRLYPQAPEGWNALGYLLADHDLRLAAARGYIERALKAKPNNPNFLDSMGWVLFRQGDLPSALRFLTEAARHSEAAEIHAHLGEALWIAGRKKDAAQVWREARARDPDNKILQETVERLAPRI